MHPAHREGLEGESEISYIIRVTFTKERLHDAIFILSKKLHHATSLIVWLKYGVAQSLFKNKFPILPLNLLFSMIQPYFILHFIQLQQNHSTGQIDFYGIHVIIYFFHMFHDIHDIISNHSKIGKSCCHI